MKKPIERRISEVVIATGVSSVATQLVLIREFLSQFHGNEFLVALILFNWLFIGGVGTFIANRSGKNACPTRLAWVSLALAMLSPLELYCIRFFRHLFFIYGSSAGFYPTFVFSFATVLPYGLLVGFALPYTLIVVRKWMPTYSGTKIYILDNIGDVLGGILFSFVLVYTLTPVQSLCAVNLLLIAAAWRLPMESRYARSGVMIGASAVLAVFGTALRFESASLNLPGLKLMFYQESRYGRIQILNDHGQHTLFLDGKPIFSNQNTELAEETIHYPLSQIHTPKHILLISAEGGIMAEIEKYRPLSVDYVEMDAVVSKAMFQFEFLKKIRGMTPIHQDGRAYLARSRKTYDAIIMNLPEPDTFQINRFYTDRFFKIAKSRLGASGILSFSIEGFDNYLSHRQIEKISSLYLTAGKVFRHILLLPGRKIFFLCSDQPMDADIPRLLEKKKIPTQYIKGFFYGDLSRERIAYINSLIQRNVPINTDYSPHLIRLMFQEWFEKFSTSPLAWTAALILALLIYLSRISREEFLLFSSGFMIMGSEILVIFVFQICFGYIYHQIGMIVTVFLAGLFPGAVLGELICRRGRMVLWITDACLILLILGLIFILIYAVGVLTPFLLMFFGFALSLACGCQFPVALYLRGSGKKAVIEAFSADLMGAAFGTLAVSVALIPYCGIIWTAFILAGLKSISWMTIRFHHETHV